MGLFNVLVHRIEEFTGELRILHFLIVLVALNILHQGLLLILDQVHLWCVFYLSVFICLLGLVLEVIIIPIFIHHSLANGAVSSQPHHFGLDTVAMGTRGSIFIGGFGIVAVTVSLAGGKGQFFLISKGCQTFFWP